jgi:hypothetical protein
MSAAKLLPNLSQLSFGCCCVESTGARHLANIYTSERFVVFQSLTRLDLSFGNIDVDGILSLIEALPHMHPRLVLDLGGSSNMSSFEVPDAIARLRLPGQTVYAGSEDAHHSFEESPSLDDGASVEESPSHNVSASAKRPRC